MIFYYYELSLKRNLTNNTEIRREDEESQQYSQPRNINFPEESETTIDLESPKVGTKEQGDNSDIELLDRPLIEHTDYT